MLDFYLIFDDETKPSYPEQIGLEYAGGISFNAFENIKNIGVIDNHYDYYSDFRWNSMIIKQISEKIKQKNMKNNTHVKFLIEILDKAILNNSGLIAYCD
jgi:hypothetical protein